MLSDIDKWFRKFVRFWLYGIHINTKRSFLTEFAVRMFLVYQLLIYVIPFARVCAEWWWGLGVWWSNCLVCQWMPWKCIIYQRKTLIANSYANRLWCYFTCFHSFFSAFFPLSSYIRLYFFFVCSLLPQFFFFFSVCRFFFSCISFLWIYKFMNI